MSNVTILLLVGLAAWIALAVGYFRVRRTTLVAAWGWALVSLLTVVAVEIAVALAPEAAAWFEPLRFVAAVSTLCPIMAQLGAKRPQHRAWQFIVAALWGMLSLPAAVAWAFHPGASLAVHPLVQWFLAILVIVGLVNRLPTRFWPASVFLFLGQIALFQDWLPLNLPIRVEPLAAVGLLCAASLTLWVVPLWPRRARQPLDQLWFDFRDHFGLVWSLRVAERINATAEAQGWNVHLGRDGFRLRTALAEPIPASLEAAVLPSFRMLLLRFVSAGWIEQRLAARADSNSI